MIEQCNRYMEYEMTLMKVIGFKKMLGAVLRFEKKGKEHAIQIEHTGK